MCREYSLKRNLIVAIVRPEIWPAGGERRRADDIDCYIATDGGCRSAVVSSVFKDIHSSLVCAKKCLVPLAVDLQDSHFRLLEDLFSNSRAIHVICSMNLTNSIAES